MQNTCLYYSGVSDGLTGMGSGKKPFLRSTSTAAGVLLLLHRIRHPLAGMLEHISGCCWQPHLRLVRANFQVSNGRQMAFDATETGCRSPGCRVPMRSQWWRQPWPVAGTLTPSSALAPWSEMHFMSAVTPPLKKQSGHEFQTARVELSFCRVHADTAPVA